MNAESSGTSLSMKTSAVFQGGYTHNGKLKKLHSFDITTGFSTITQAVGVDPKAGFGVFIDPTARDGKVYTVKPAGGVAFGILLWNAYLNSSQPSASGKIREWNKDTIGLRGFVEYKTGYTTAGVESLGYKDVQKGFLLCINDLNGQPTFAATVPAGFTQFGKVIFVDPENHSWTVELTA